MALCVLPSAVAGADPLHDTANGECAPNNTATWSLGNAPFDPIWVYFENDIGDEFSACQPSGSPSIGISNTQFINVVRRAMDTWNAESRGPVFMYAGTVAADDVYPSCLAFQEPAVLVRFEPGCDAKAGQCTTASARVETVPIPQCGGTSRLSFFGQSGITGGGLPCSESACTNLNCRKTYSADGENGGRDLQALAVHELGHVLDLAHPFSLANDPFDGICQPASQNPSPSLRCSVMDLNSSRRESNRHLFAWEKDCADDAPPGADRWERLLTIRGYGFDGRGDGTGEFASLTTAKGPGPMTSVAHDGFVGGGPTDAYWAYADDTFRVFDWLDYDGFLLSYSLSWALPAHLQALDISPTVLYQREYPIWEQNYQTVISYEKPPFKVPPDPPGAVFSSSVTAFWSHAQMFLTHGGTAFYESNIPIVPAWDPASGRTIFVSVQTPRATSDSYDDAHGRIRIHPGSGPGPEDLLPGIELGTLPLLFPPTGYTSSPQFSYTAKTDFPPGIACAGPGAPEYNCIIAWSDRGVPDGKILYFKFKVDAATDSVIPDPIQTVPPPDFGLIPNVHEVPNAAALDGVSLTYRVDRYWLAYKTIDGTYHDIAVHRLPSPFSPADWWSPFYVGLNHPVVGLPSWAASPDGNPMGWEYALFWTALTN